MNKEIYILGCVLIIFIIFCLDKKKSVENYINASNEDLQNLSNNVDNVNIKLDNELLKIENIKNDIDIIHEQYPDLYIKYSNLKNYYSKLQSFIKNKKLEILNRPKLNKIRHYVNGAVFEIEYIDDKKELFTFKLPNGYCLYFDNDTKLLMNKHCSAIDSRFYFKGVRIKQTLTSIKDTNPYEMDNSFKIVPVNNEKYAMRILLVYNTDTQHKELVFNFKIDNIDNGSLSDDNLFI
jgi:hypothetical protein